MSRPDQRLRQCVSQETSTARLSMQRHMLEHSARQGTAVKEFMYVFFIPQPVFVRLEGRQKKGKKYLTRSWSPEAVPRPSDESRPLS